MDSRTVLLTGASGMVGYEVLQWILANTCYRVFVLAHKSGREVASHERITVYRGDISLPNLGLTESEYEQLRTSVTDVIHAAGTTNFGGDIETARRINVAGTKHVINFAKNIPTMQRFGFVSSAYVAGCRSGTVLESELEHDQGFVNTYEQSKYETEQYLLDVTADFQIYTYRLSTLLGDSSNGRTLRYTAPHQLMRFVRLGLVSMLPGSAQNAVDLVATDYATSTLCTLQFLPSDGGNETFHIAAGQRNSATVGELIDVTFEVLSRDPDWKSRVIERPLLVNKEAFDLFLSSIEEMENPLFKQVLLNTRYFADQLLYPKDFQCSALERMLPGCASRMPSVRETYEKVLLFCIQTNWGKKIV